MTDPRITLGPDLIGTAGDAVIEALDELRPIVRVDPSMSPASASATAAMVLILGRLHPHIEIDGDANLGPNPWGAATITDALAKSRAAIPAPTRAPGRDLIIGVGDTISRADVWIGGDDWTAVVAATPSPVCGSRTGYGLHAAAALAAAEVSKRTLGPLGMIHVPRTGDPW